MPAGQLGPPDAARCHRHALRPFSLARLCCCLAIALLSLSLCACCCAPALACHYVPRPSRQHCRCTHSGAAAAAVILQDAPKVAFRPSPKPKKSKKWCTACPIDVFRLGTRAPGDAYFVEALSCICLLRLPYHGWPSEDTHDFGPSSCHRWFVELLNLR